MVYSTLCPGEHLLLNCEMVLEMVARSGRVWQLSQLRDPVLSSCTVALIFLRSFLEAKLL